MRAESFSVNRNHRNELAALGAILMVSVITYMDIFSFWAYRDELRHLTHMHNLSGTADYLGIPPWIRPLEVFVNLANVQLFGYEATHFSHAVSLTAFLCCIALVYHISKTVGAGANYYPVVAAALFAFHPVNVASVYRIDTISQQFVTLFALIFLSWLLSNRNPSGLRVAVISFALTACLLFSKETSLGLVLAIPLAAYIIKPGTPLTSFRMTPNAKALATAWAIGAVTLLAYIILRQDYVANALGDSATRYHVGFSLLGIVKNTALSIASLFYFGNSLDFFADFNPGKIAVTVIFSIFVSGLCLTGLVSFLRKNDVTAIRLVLGLLFLALSGFFPAVLIEKVNELYSYGSSPYSSMLVALLACEGYTVIRRKTPTAGYTIPFLFLPLCLWMLYGIAGKLEYADEENRRANLVYTQMKEWVISDLNESLCIAKFDAPRERSYNMFLSPNLDLIWSVFSFVKGTTQLPLSFETDESSDTCRYRIAVTERSGSGPDT